VIGKGSDHMGFCPVSQCSYENTRDDDPIRLDQFFHEWLAEFKKIVDVASIPVELMANYRAEWETMAIQRCFKINDRGEPDSFSFTIESIGIRPVKDLVAEGIQAVIRLVTPYTNQEVDESEIGITMQPVDSRMNGVDVLFEGQEHTLGNLLQTLLTEIYLNGAPDSPIEFAGYKVRHPLQRIMALRIGIREGAGDAKVIARQVIVAAAERAKEIFESLATSWAAVDSSGPRAVNLEG
jgi:DNA-directed RNA polymerase subunit L